MGYQEMITLVFALVLFTSIAMVANNNLLSQTEHLHNSFYELQAMQISQRYFDEIDEKLFSEVIRLNAIGSMYDGTNNFILENCNINYFLEISSTYSDSLGNNSTGETLFYKVDMIISTQPDVIKPIRMSRLYADY
ncbi:MAG: hypothetical protein K8S23_04775 [Candidatus Cloacimonetes bacterium]|nr:hypothetical protein [Candidatus Cloacimonadota bacterium]